MKVLVAYATRHGATGEIAARLAQVLGGKGHEVSLHEAGRTPDLSRFDAYVIGSAAYAGSWLTEASELVRRHRDMLAARPLWLFSSGPIGHETVDKKGRDVVQAAEPKEFAEFADLGPRGRQVFFGAFDPDAKPIGLLEKLGAPFLRLGAVRKAMPAGDFRDWPAIEAWAEEIAAELQPAMAHA